MELDNHNIVYKDKVFTYWDYPVYGILSCLSLLTISYFLFHWFSLKDFLDYPFFYIITSFIVISMLINHLGKWMLLPLMRKPRPMTAQSDWKVAVVTSFVPKAEPFEMLEETLEVMVAIDYPHDTWVLDEEDNDRVKQLCKRLGVNHFSRINDTQHQTDHGIFKSFSKHGNYNAWLYAIGFKKYDIISAFDPDHIPQKTFLHKVLKYFQDPSIGYVQAAQAYHNQQASFIARGAAEETYDYYASIQMASYGMDYPIIVGGHNTHRVTALQQIGGFAPHDADDLLSTILYRNHGWKGVYVPEILARGLTPVDWNGYLTQQRRWARSVLDVKLRQHPKLLINLNVKSRIMCCLHGLNYIYKGFLNILLGLILMMFMLLYGTSPMAFSSQMLPKAALLCGVLLACDFYHQRFYLDWRHERGLHLRATLLQYAKWPYFLLAFIDIILNRPKPYVLTRKIRTKDKSYMLLWPNVIIVIFISTSWIIGLYSGRIAHPFLYCCAAITLLSSLFLIISEHLKFPDPYSKQ